MKNLYQEKNEIFLRICISLIAFSSPAGAREESLPIGELLKSSGVKGMFVLHDAGGQRYIGHHEARACKRFVTASTFKIPNSLIEL